MHACLQVLKFELAADGVLWSEGSGKTSNVYVLKSKDAPPSVASQQQNVQPVLIIPNEPSIDCVHLHDFNALCRDVSQGR
jgi:hypothetical protein